MRKKSAARAGNALNTSPSSSGSANQLAIETGTPRGESTSEVTPTEPLFQVVSPRMDDHGKLKRLLGGALLHAREQSGLTQAEVASRVGIAPAVYGRIERGQMLPSVPTLCHMCVTLKVSSDVLLGLDDAERAALAAPPMPEAPPELRRLAALVRTLSPSALRMLTAVAFAVGR
jgi:transcriptional regulator with XRE-family HTH domain